MGALIFLDQHLVWPKPFWTQIICTQHFFIKDYFNPSKSIGTQKTFGLRIRFDLDFLISIFDNLLNNLIQLSNLPISMEILGNYDTKTNQLVLTPKQLNLVWYIHLCKSTYWSQKTGALREGFILGLLAEVRGPEPFNYNQFIFLTPEMDCMVEKNDHS